MLHDGLVILHYNSTWLRRTQTWVYGQVKQQQRLGLNVHVVCRRVSNEGEFNVDNLHNMGSESVFRKIRRVVLEYFRIPDRQPYLTRKANLLKADVVHSHFGNIGWENLPALRRLDVRHVVTFYGYDVNKIPVQDAIWLERYRELFSEADLFLCEGPHMARCIVDMGCPVDKVRVHHLGVNVDQIPFVPRQWRSGETLRVLIAAAFREKKGIPYAIEALGIVARDVTIELTIIGDAGPSPDQQSEKDAILALLHSTGLIGRTRLLGFMPHQVMLRESLEHHLFLQPSVTASDGDTEGGAPVAIIEMLASGMPVVATTHCDIPEVMGPEFAHLLAPERDSERLADCIKLLLSSADEWTSLLKSGRCHIEQEYNVAHQAERQIEIYSDISRAANLDIS